MRLGGISNMVSGSRATGTADDAGATAFARALGNGPARAGGANQTAAFSSDPGAHLHDILTTLAGSGPGASLPAARPGVTVSGHENVVPFQAHAQPDGSMQLSLSALGQEAAEGPSSLAHYLPYSNAGSQHQQGLTTSIQVPAHPAGGEPGFVLTPGLSGCAFYGRDNGDGTVTFSHTSPPHGGSVSVPQGAAGTDYGTYGRTAASAGPGVPTALAFAHYDPGQRQWAIHEQRQQLVPDLASPKPDVVLTGFAQHLIR